MREQVKQALTALGYPSAMAESIMREQSSLLDRLLYADRKPEYIATELLAASGWPPTPMEAAILEFQDDDDDEDEDNFQGNDL